MIGQEVILNQFAGKTPQTFPKTIMFLGDRGSGRHLLAKKLAANMEFEVKEITKNITPEELTSFMFSPIKTLYIIDIDEFIERQQNQFLKFIEEPSDSVYICIIASSDATVLPTILNRCLKYYLKPYTLEELKAITQTDYIELAYKVCNTPGKLLSVDISNLVDMYNDCKYLVLGLTNKPFANTLLASTRINYKENWDKYDYYTFFDMLEYVAYDAFIEGNVPQAFEVYKIVNWYKKNLCFKAAHKENLIYSLIIDIWKEAQTWK